jgi:hypothetical protein
MQSIYQHVGDLVLEPAIIDVQPDVVCERPQLHWKHMSMLKDPRERAQHMSHFVEVIEQLPGPVNYAKIKELMTSTNQNGKLCQKLEDLEQPLGMKVHTPKSMAMQPAIVPETGGNTFTVVKHYHVPSKVDIEVWHIMSNAIWFLY